MLIRYLSCFETLFIAIHIVTYSICQGLYSRTATDMPMPNTNKLCITLITDYSNGKIGKDNAIRHILEAFRELDVYKRVTPRPVQIQTTISTYIRMLDQAESAQEVAAL